MAAAAAANSDQVDALTAAAKALLGSDFQIYPEFTLGVAQASEWSNAITYSESGALTNYLTTTAKVDFPVDEWRLHDEHFGKLTGQEETGANVKARRSWRERIRCSSRRDATLTDWRSRRVRR